VAALEETPCRSAPPALARPDTIAHDVHGEPMPGLVTGVEPEPPHSVERAPPIDRDCLGPAAPNG